MRRLHLKALVLLLALLVPVVTAQALPAWMPGDMVVATAGPESAPMDVTAKMLDDNSTNTVENPDGSVTFMMGSMTMAGMWEWTWSSITLDPDPIVSIVGGFSNISGMPQDFVFSVATPISPSLPSTLYGGSTNVTYGDANFDGLGGLFKDTAGNPAYTGTIDGTGILNMLTSLNLTPAFPGDSTPSASQVLGLPGPTLPDGPANSTIGILHRFNLSPGDNATFNSTFQVVIPEPATIALLAAGLGGLALLGRRR